MSILVKTHDSTANSCKNSGALNFVHFFWTTLYCSLLGAIFIGSIHLTMFILLIASLIYLKSSQVSYEGEQCCDEEKKNT